MRRGIRCAGRTNAAYHFAIIRCVAQMERI